MTRMEKLDALLPRILPQVLSCPKSMALDALQIIAGDFCRQAGAWLFTLQESVFAEDCRIGLNPLRDTIVTEVLALYLDHRLVDTTSYTPFPQEIVLNFTPASETLATVQVAVRPSRTAEAIPAGVMEEWGDILAFGALAKLKSMSGTGIEWTDSQGAAMNLSLYNDGCYRAKTQMFRRRYGGGSLYITGMRTP